MKVVKARLLTEFFRILRFSQSLLSFSSLCLFRFSSLSIFFSNSLPCCFTRSRSAFHDKTHQAMRLDSGKFPASPLVPSVNERGPE